METDSILRTLSKFSGISPYVGSHEELVLDLIPFHIPQLDMMIGSGIPCGRFVELTGDWGVGKSFLTQRIIWSAQRLGRQCVYFNVENKFDPIWFHKTGVNLNDLIVVQGNALEDIIDACIALIKEKVGLIVVDSIASMLPTLEEEGDMADNTIALQARQSSKGFRKMTGPLSSSKTSVVFTNQLRSSIGGYGGSVYPGGRAQNFYSSMTLAVRRGEWIVNEGNERIGFQMVVRTDKNTIAPPYRECALPFYFEGFVDMAESICTMALDNGFITQSGAWFTVGDNRFQGRGNMHKFFQENPEELKNLSSQVSAFLLPQNNMEVMTNGTDPETT